MNRLALRPDPLPRKRPNDFVSTDPIAVVVPSLADPRPEIDDALVPGEGCA